MKKLLIFFCVMLFFFGITGVANATLWDRGGGLIYDDVLDITWLQNANYGATELTDARRDAIISEVGSINGHTLVESDFVKDGSEYTGQMTWWGAMAWADQLVFSGYDDWRLPDAHNQDGTGPEMGFTKTGSEMGHMFYNNLGGSAWSFPGSDFIDGNGDNVSFQNLQSTNEQNVYWSGTEYATNPDLAWYLQFVTGNQSIDGKDFYYYAWVVRDGDVIPHTHCVSSSAELQDALNVAANNSTPDIIRIRSSVDPYVGNPVYSSTEPYGLTIEGGYNSDCSARVVDPATVLDGDNTGRVLTFDCSGVAADLVVDGLTLQNGNANGQGGGLFAVTNGTVTLTNNNIINNIGGDGGGIFFNSSSGSVTLTNNTINNNSATMYSGSNGGGIFFNSSSGSVTLTNNTINNNNGSTGGGVYLWPSYGSAILINNIISNNSATSGSGGIFFRSYNTGSITLTNNTISENSAQDRGGGGSFIPFYGTVTLTNNIIWNNSADDEGGDLYIENDGNNNTVNLFNNNFTDTYIQDSSSVNSENNINAEPEFDTDGYHLTDISPCIDAGVDAGVYDDIDGDSRPQGAGYDIGADEYVISDSDGDGIPDDEDACLFSDLSDTVIIDGCDSNVDNL